MKRVCLILLAAVCLRAAAGEVPRGLYVRDGVLLQAGRPYHGVGANYFSLLTRRLKDPADTSSLSNLAALARARIPFVRFSCGGFWPVEQQLYVTNRAAFFARLDRVVRCAETNGVGLIPSLFWNVSLVPDLVGEHLDEYGNPDSRTIAFLRRYTADLVRRCRDSPALWGWEFGNEYNLACDLPNASQQRPPVVPALGTARTRTERDELKFAQLRVAFTAFAETVRQFDRTRPIFSGNAIPRASAWHNLHDKSWTADTETQFAEILLRDNPAPLDTLTMHLYPDGEGVYSGGAKSIGDAVGLANQCATQAAKPLFLGEFGAGRQLGPRARQQAVFQEFLDAIVRHRVPLAAFWVFDYDAQDRDWNVSFANDRAWMIGLVVEANRKLAATPAR